MMGHIRSHREKKSFEKIVLRISMVYVLLVVLKITPRNHCIKVRREFLFLVISLVFISIRDSGLAILFCDITHTHT